MSAKNSPASLDADSRAMIYEGVNLSQLTVIFGMDHRVLVQKMHGLAPTGVRRGVNIYSIKDAATRLWRPTQEEVDEAIKRMNHADLPKQLTKEYWSGLRTKQEVELAAGDLWRTTEVAEKVGELFKTVKIQMTLAKDTVERTTELTEKQRQLLIDITDGVLSDLERAIIENFGDKVELENGEEEDEDAL